MLSPMNFIACNNPGRAPKSAPLTIRAGAKWALLTLLWASHGSLAEADFIDTGLASSAASPAQALVEPTPAIEAKISAAQAAEIVRRKTGGQVMSVNSRQTPSGVIYGVKVLNSGRMKVIQVDGQSGQVVKQ